MSEDRDARFVPRTAQTEAEGRMLVYEEELLARFVA